MTRFPASASFHGRARLLRPRVVDQECPMVPISSTSRRNIGLNLFLSSHIRAHRDILDPLPTARPPRSGLLLTLGVVGFFLGQLRRLPRHERNANGAPEAVAAPVTMAFWPAHSGRTRGMPGAGSIDSGGGIPW